jgi:hypothetical protein
MDTKLSQIIDVISPLVEAILRHKILTAITSIEKFRRFTEIHVYAVWDFMCLLKALQRKLTTHNPLWSPPANPLGCHLVNTLLAEEESDALPNNHYSSHFELYLAAMQQLGANIQPISDLIDDVKAMKPLSALLARDDLPQPAQHFIQDTFDVIKKGNHRIAASLTFAREHITSNMFSTLLQMLGLESPADIFGL